MPTKPSHCGRDERALATATTDTALQERLITQSRDMISSQTDGDATQ